MTRGKQLLGRRRVACARRRRTARAPRAAPRCSIAATRSRPRRSARSPRPSCARAAGCARGRRAPSRSRTSSNTRDVAGPEPPLERPRIGEARRRARPRPRTRRRSRLAPATSASVHRSPSGRRLRIAAKLTSPPSSFACTSSGIDAPISSVRYVSNASRSAASGRRDRRARPRSRSSCSPTRRRRIVRRSSLTRTARAPRPARRPTAPRPHRQQRRAAARPAGPRRPARVDAHAGIERGRAQLDAGRRVPQQRGPRAVPAHRERQRPGAQRQRVDGERLAEPLGREAREQIDGAALLAHERGAQRRQEPRRVARRVGRAHRRPRSGDASAGARAAGRASRDAAQPAAASSSKPQSSSAATTAGSRRGASRRSARAASTSSPIGGGSCAWSPRSSWRSHPRATAAAPGRSRTATRTDVAEARAARTHVRCGTGNSSASSIGAVERVDGRRCCASPLMTSLAAVVARGPRTRRTRRRRARASRRRATPRRRPRPRPRRATAHDERDGQRDRRLVLDLHHDDRPARRGRRRRRGARRRPPGTRTDVSRIGAGAAPMLTGRDLLGRDVPPVVGADPPVEREVRRRDQAAIVDARQCAVSEHAYVGHVLLTGRAVAGPGRQ